MNYKVCVYIYIVEFTDYLIISMDDTILGVNLNPEITAVPFVPKTNPNAVQGIDYDFVTRTVYFSEQGTQKLKKWIIGSPQVIDINTVVPYNVTGLDLQNRF